MSNTPPIDPAGSPGQTPPASGHWPINWESIKAAAAAIERAFLMEINEILAEGVQ